MFKVRVTSRDKASNFISTDTDPTVDRKFCIFTDAVRYASEKAVLFPTSRYAVVEVVSPKEVLVIQGVQYDD